MRRFARFIYCKEGHSGDKILEIVLLEQFMIEDTLMIDIWGFNDRKKQCMKMAKSSMDNEHPDSWIAGTWIRTRWSATTKNE